jgi:copper homeostasis protein
MKQVEIACCNLDSIINANKGGASRIELFENLIDGGCTPSYGMMKKAKEISTIPIYVMIRPRGGDFEYSKDELDIMKSDIEICHQLNIDGIVFGILDENNEINFPACKELLKLWNNKSATFHRAIDVSADIEKSIKMIIDLGFERVLTSGGRATAIDGRDTILEMNRKYGQRISIMAGSGITSENVHLFAELNEVHATCKMAKLGERLFENYTCSSAEIVSDLKSSFFR